LNLKYKLTVFFAVYIIALSFIPLVHDTMLAQGKWIGYGTGAYEYQNQHYFVLFNDPYDGSSKPHIHVNPDFAPAARISLLEFSDWTSWVNDHNFFNEFNATVRTNPRELDVTYARPEIVIHKLIEVSSESVKVTLTSDQEFRAHLEIWPHEKGFNRISIDFVNSEMSFTVSGSMQAVGTTSPTWSYALLPYVLPVVAIGVVALYLLVDKYGRTLKNRATGASS